jgi:hypothetical protein
MKSIRNKIILAVCFLAFFSSCKKDEGTSTPVIPPIPELTPASSFSMEFSDFSDTKSVNLLKKNWLYSSVNVTFFSLIATENMAVPTLAFTESFNHIPTYIGDMTWQWSYNVPFIGATYTAKLNGITQSNKKVKWEMYIDKVGTGGFSNFLWFEGTTTDSTSASWIVYETPATPTPAINIEWISNTDYSEYTLKYTFVTSKIDNTNSYVEFGTSPKNTFDRYYTIYLNKEKATINIEWDSVNKDGRVKSPVYFTDESWHCWNKSLQDSWCD